MGRERLRTAGLAAALAAVVLVPLAIWAASSLSDEETAGLRIEASSSPVPRLHELVVALPNDELNTLETTDGTPSVGLECLDPEGRAELRVEHPFPFSDTDGGLEPPHVHQRIGVEQLDRIERCRLDGTDPELVGVVDGTASPFTSRREGENPSAGEEKPPRQERRNSPQPRIEARPTRLGRPSRATIPLRRSRIRPATYPPPPPTSASATAP